MILRFPFTYNRDVQIAGLVTDADITVQLTADVHQDGGQHCDSELLLLWTPETDAAIARLDLDAEELAGVVDAAHDAWFEREEAACRVASARQRAERAVA